MSIDETIVVIKDLMESERTTQGNALIETGDGQILPVTQTAQPPMVVAMENQAKALVLLSQTLAPIAAFFQGQTMANMLQANAKSEATSAIVSAAIGKLGFDATRVKTYATEIPHLVEAIFSKIEEREKAKAQGDMFGPDVDAEAAFRDHENQVKQNA